ncbi:MAG TPA: hypothetical protein VKZ97_08025 [Flavobacteriaceae bacterium]|nr:hypothetical protein [Flavobacteriaceae bacterium]
MKVKNLIAIVVSCFFSVFASGQAQWEQYYDQGVNYFNNYNFSAAETSFEQALNHAKVELSAQAQEPITIRFYYATTYISKTKVKRL